MRFKSLSIALTIAAGAFLIIDGTAGPRTLQFTIATPEDGILVRTDDAGAHVSAVSESGELLPTLTDPGFPALPVRAVNVLIPPGERVVSVHARSRRDVVIARDARLALAPAAVTDPEAPAPRVLPEPTAALATVGGDGSYPSELVHYAGSGTWRGYTVASIIVYPVRSRNGSVLASPEIELSVELEATAGGNGAVRRARLSPTAAVATDRQLRELVINPGDAAGYPVAASPSYRGPFQPTSIPSLDGSPVECVIITTEELAAPFDSLALWKTVRGVPTVVRTVEWIEANYRRGTDLAEAIRFFLRDAYSKWGTEHVLLGGDTQQVPARYLYSTFFYGGTSIPADIYYAGLDGTFNADGDALFGEQPADAPDLYTELNVARLPASSLEAANTIVSKIKAYETPADPEYMDKVLYLAEVLFPTPWSPGMSIQSNGAVIADEINLFVNSPDRRIARMFETPEIFPGSVQESRVLAIDSLAAGYNMVFHVGHGYRFNMHCADDNVATSDADALHHPDREFNLFMLNCSAAAFDYDCLGEHLLFNPNGGALSVIGASNSAFPNQARYYAHAYAKAIYTFGERHIGEAFEQSRAARTSFAMLGDGGDLWTHYVYTILADPEMPLWTAAIRYPAVTAPASVPAGNNDIVVQVQVGGLAEAGAAVCLYKGGEDYVAGSTDAGGTFSAPFSTARAGAISVVVTGMNLARTQRWIDVVPTGGAQLAVDSVIVDDDNVGASSGNGDGRIEAGETVELRPRFRNVGGAPSLAASSAMSTPSPGVAISIGSLDVPPIAPDSTWTPDGATWAVSTDVGATDRTRVLFDITTTHQSDTWNAQFAAEMHAPQLEIIGLRTSDALPVGDGDGILSPGESYRLFATVKNYGSGHTGPLTATIGALDPGATVTAGVSNFPDLGLLQAAENAPSFELSEANTGIENPLQLTVVDAMGRVTQRTIELRPPAAPVIESFDATLGLDKIQVAWDKSPSSDVAGYRVQRSPSASGPFEPATLDIVPHTVFTDDGLTPSTRYYFTVTAVDSSGNESSPSAVGSASTNPPQLSGWPNAVPDPSANSPAIGDIDGDGYPEIIIGNDRLYAWHHDGREVRDGDGQPASFGVFESVGDDFLGPPALGNIDGNPGLEIVAAAYTSQEVYIFDGAGNVLPGWPQATVDLVRANVALGDVDGDGNLDVVAVDQDAYLYVWHTDGSELIDGDFNPATNGVFKRLPDTNQWQYQAPALADLDGDGKDEVIIPTQDNKLYVFNEDGSDLAGWPRSLPNYAGGGVVVGDIDNNGDLELVVTVRSSGETYALNHDNTVMFTRWLQHNLFFNPAPVLADLTGDGKLEVIIPSSNGKMYAIQYNGSDAPGWPVTYSTKTYTECPAVVADVTGDGEPDVLLGDEEKLIGGWDRTGQPLDGFPLVVKDAMRGSPAVVDLDINGDAEIVAVGYDRTVYVWDLATPFDPTRAPWPMGRANIHRNGVYGSPVATGIPGGPAPAAQALRLDQNHPNPFNPVTTIGFQLPTGSHRVVLSIYDVTGARVRTLVDGVLPGGAHTATWDGRNQSGTPVGSGVYFYRLATEHRSDTRKMVLLK